MKFKGTRFFFSILASVAFLCIAAILPARADNPNDPKTPTKNLLETAAEAGEFTLLKKALKETGLDKELLSGDFTIFAPNDAAFKRLQPQVLENIMADKEGLRRILLYHVVEGKKTAADVTKLTEIKTMQGSKAQIKVKPDKVKIDRAQIIRTDILATNGVIHVIDKILTPTE